MAATFVQKSTQLFADNASSIAPSLSGVTAGNHLVLLVSASPSSGAAALAQPSGWVTAEAPAGQLSGGAENAVGAIFYKENAPSGTNSATVTLVANTWATASIVESNSATSSSLDVHNATGGTTGTSGATPSVTSTQADSIVFVVGNAENGVNTAGFSSPAATGYTSIATNPSNATHIASDFSYKLLSATGSQSGSWTWTNSSAWVAAIAVFKAAGGPTITSEPTNQTVKNGTTATFTVAATGTGGLTYQWQLQQGGAWSDISGATSASYTTPTLAAADSAGYRCNVTDTIGTTASNAASLTVARAQKAFRVSRGAAMDGGGVN